MAQLIQVASITDLPEHYKTLYEQIDHWKAGFQKKAEEYEFTFGKGTDPVKETQQVVRFLEKFLGHSEPSLTRSQTFFSKLTPLLRCAMSTIKRSNN